MASGIEIQQFINALRTGKGAVARALDDLFGLQAIPTWKDPKSPLGPHLAELDSPDFAVNPLPQWAVDELKGKGGLVAQPLSDEEIGHINGWPPKQKDRIRQAAWQAITSNRSVQFFWELWDGDQTETKVHDAGTGEIIVTFRTPRTKVMYSAGKVQLQVP